MPAELGGIDAVLGEKIIERRPCDAEEFGRARQISLRDREGLPDGLRLGVLPRYA